MKRHAGLMILVFVLASSCAMLDKTLVAVGEATGNRELAKAGADITPRQEYYLGRSISANVLSERPLLKNRLIQGYVNMLGQYLALHSQRPNTFKGYRFAVVEGEEPAAMSAPGGFIFVSEGMLRALRNEEELAAVIAHEIAHIELRHAEDIIKKQKKTGLAMQLLSKAAKDKYKDDVPEELLDWGANGIEKVLNSSFDKNQEMDADAGAVRILTLAGYDPKGMKWALGRVKDSATFLGRHPSNEERVESLLEKLKDAKTPKYRGVRQKRFRLYTQKYL